MELSLLPTEPLISPRGEGAGGIKDIFVALGNRTNAISPAAGSPAPSGLAKLGEQREAGTRGYARPAAESDPQSARLHPPLSRSRV